MKKRSQDTEMLTAVLLKFLSKTPADMLEHVEPYIRDAVQIAELADNVECKRSSYILHGMAMGMLAGLLVTDKKEQRVLETSFGVVPAVARTMLEKYVDEEVISPNVH